MGITLTFARRVVGKEIREKAEAEAILAKNKKQTFSVIIAEGQSKHHDQR